MTEKTLLDLQPGDEVIVDHGGLSIYSKPRLAKVDRVTATQIIIGDDRYNRSNGKLRGGTSYYGNKWLSVPTSEDRARVLLNMKRDQAMRAVMRLKDRLNNLPESLIDKILEVYKESEKNAWSPRVL